MLNKLSGESRQYVAVLNECERGEDAAKAAYRDALDSENELNPELAQVLQIQQNGIPKATI